MVTLLRSIKFGLQNAWRNFGLSAITVTILVLMVLSVNTVIGIGAITNAAVDSVKSQVDISIFFEADASQETVDEVVNVINTFPDVKEITVKSSAQVMEEFRALHADDEAIQFSVQEIGDGLFGPTVIVRTNEPGQYAPIIAALDIPEYENIIESRTFDDSSDIIGQIDLVTSRAKTIAWVVTILFGVVAFLIVASSIRVAIFTQREEISIQKLVGAGNWFIKAPFIVEVILYSTLAMIISLVILYFGTTLSDPYIRRIFGSYPFSLYEFFLSNGAWIFITEFFALIIMSLISGLISMRRFLKV